jgi:nitrogen fixation NifU-like protein
MEDLVHLEQFYIKATRHANDPHYLGALAVFNGHAKITGPCGDTMEFWVHVQDGRIARVSFVTDGCWPSLASGSMTTCLADGKTVEEARELLQEDVLEALDGLPDSHKHCAMLSTNTLRAACDDYLEKKHDGGGKRDRKENV